MKKTLKDIAEISSGYQFRGKVTASDDANVAVIQIKDVDEQFNVHTFDLVQVKLDNADPYLVSQGDVLFLSRGHRQYAALVTEQVQNTIATGYFFILRPKAGVIQPSFLAWTINQHEFQESMKPFVRGSHIPLISKADFQNLTVQVPPFPVQQRIMELYRLFNLERDLTAAIQSKRGELFHAISQRLMTGQLHIRGES